ncbi:MAG: undecaprenyl-diphosphate phosphatase [Nitrospirae bacterium]|nr:undecaprenyl-diphosphate phosphatase [Nitrospirota bacterium]
MDAEIFKAFIMGITQGITEFFPVSSTAHLILFPWFFGWGGELDTLTFDIALHAGTLSALLVCFYKDILYMFTENRRALFSIVIATIPAGLAGVLFHDVVENTLRSPIIIVISLVVFGGVMLIAEKYNKRNAGSEDSNGSADYKQTHRPSNAPSIADSIFIGVAQAIALIPGVSRSGSTISAGLFRKMTREQAARFSFLLSMPVIAGATLLHCKNLLHGQESYRLDLFAVGFISAFVSGFFAIKFLLAFLKKYPLNIFVYYRFLLAGIILAAYIVRQQ